MDRGFGRSDVRGVNDQLWWHVARATGLVAWLALASAMISGGLLASRLIRRPDSVRRTVGVHRHLAAVALMLVVGHLSALIADSYVRFTMTDLLIPMSSTWRPGAVAWGIVALYLALVVEISSLAGRRWSRRTWRRIHRLSAMSFAAATAHLFTAGTDARHNVVMIPFLLLICVVTFLYLARPLGLVGRRLMVLPPTMDAPAAGPPGHVVNCPDDRVPRQA